MLDSDVVLVVGPRGSGKSEIALVLAQPALVKAASEFAPRVRLPRSAEWLAAYQGPGNDVFEDVGLKRFFSENGNRADAMRDVWLAYLLRKLKDRFDAKTRDELASMWAPPAADVSAVVSAFRGLGVRPIVALDELDRKLDAEDRSLFVTYDELDTLGERDWSLIEAGVRGLVALWAAYTRRWSRLRGKLFLRTDLYERHARIGGADLYKLAASRVELRWSDRDLYSMLLKRLANAEDDNLSEYVRHSRLIEWSKHSVLGWMPTLRQWDDARPVIERIAGQYMGANQKKGYVYRWLLDHVRDGAGRAYPRPLVGLIEKAAGQELNHSGRLRKPRLLQPASLRSALNEVSADHVTESLHEWPWFNAIKQALQAQVLVPYDEKDLVQLLALTTQWTGKERPPFESYELVAYLVEIGLLRRRPDGRLDVPDLFLSGLGLKRKGGVGVAHR